MKTVAALSLLASASAFAPASTGSRVRDTFDSTPKLGLLEADATTIDEECSATVADGAASLCMYEDLPSRYEDVAMYPRGVKCCGKHMHEMRLAIDLGCATVAFPFGTCESLRVLHSYVVADGGNQI